MLAPNFPEQLSAWLSRVANTETPAADVKAFNVGLFETEAGFSAYLVGATEYDDSSDDWACQEAFTPQERYFAIPVEGKVPWQEMQASAALAVKGFLHSEAGMDSFLARADFVTVGFDDGDLERVK